MGGGENRYNGGSKFYPSDGKLIMEVRERRAQEMEWQFILALVIAVPIILFPAAFVWFLNVGGIYAAMKEARAKRVAHEKGTSAAVVAK